MPEMPMSGFPTEDPGMGMDPSIPSEGGLTQEEMKGNISEMMDKVQSKFGELNSQNFTDKNAVEADRQDKLKQVLMMLQSQGVDVHSQESIQNFMDKMEQESPDMFILFEKALNSLLGDDGDMPPEEVDQGQIPQDLGLTGPPMPPGLGGAEAALPPSPMVPPASPMMGM